MKFDPDLCRGLLIKASETDTVLIRIPPKCFSDHSFEELAEHLIYMEEAKFIEISDMAYGGSHLSFGGTHGQRRNSRLIRNLSFRLTYEGHQFLAQCRDETFWCKAKHNLKQHGLPITLDALKHVLNSLISQSLKLIQ